MKLNEKDNSFNYCVFNHISCFNQCQTSPCQDKEFLRLRDESINNMTEKEYQYFLMMSELCVLEINKSKSSNSIGSKRNILWILVGIQLVAFIYDDVLDLD